MNTRINFKFRNENNNILSQYMKTIIKFKFTNENDNFKFIDKKYKFTFMDEHDN